VVPKNVEKRTKKNRGKGVVTPKAEKPQKEELGSK